jgi:hypothetical protein
VVLRTVNLLLLCPIGSSSWWGSVGGRRRGIVGGGGLEAAEGYAAVSLNGRHSDAIDDCALVVLLV